MDLDGVIILAGFILLGLVVAGLVLLPEIVTALRNAKWLDDEQNKNGLL